MGGEKSKGKREEEGGNEGRETGKGNEVETKRIMGKKEEEREGVRDGKGKVETKRKEGEGRRG